ncbi:MAG: hypothetical protein M1168_00130 [Candidatus Marsarchaeota archaeon]|jgi:hypothetical protein|nr:hypothetical protein [Candidatus Marsarchaeota archaeon]MCL5094379.1 hypothetical protein [Candidatus Marsarchaeota archaeon]
MSKPIEIMFNDKKFKHHLAKNTWENIDDIIYNKNLSNSEKRLEINEMLLKLRNEGKKENKLKVFLRKLLK